MSVPGSGHPDWQAYANWRGTLKTTAAVNYHTGVTAIGTFITTNYASVYVSALGTSGSGQLVLDWFADDAATMPTETVTFNVTGITLFNVLVPASGNSVKVSFNNDLVPDCVFSFSLLPMNIPVAKPVFHVDPTDTGEFEQLVSHSTTHSVAVNQIMGGLAHVYFDPELGTGKMAFKLYSVDQDGLRALRLVNFTNLAGPSQQLIVLPSRPLIVDIINSDAVNDRAISWALITTGE